MVVFGAVSAEGLMVKIKRQDMPKYGRVFTALERDDDDQEKWVQIESEQVTKADVDVSGLSCTFSPVFDAFCALLTSPLSLVHTTW